jgi:hypothetical protein
MGQDWIYEQYETRLMRVLNHPRTRILRKIIAQHNVDRLAVICVAQSSRVHDETCRIANANGPPRRPEQSRHRRPARNLNWHFPRNRHALPYYDIGRRVMADASVMSSTQRFEQGWKDRHRPPWEFPPDPKIAEKCQQQIRVEEAANRSAVQLEEAHAVWSHRAV